MTSSLYDMVGGSEGLLRLAHAWHRRCLADPIANHPFSHPGLHPQHSERLAAYWAEAIGGPPAYTASMGDHSHVMRMHAGNGVHPELDERCIELFALAMDDAGIPAAARGPLGDYFRRVTELMSQFPRSASDVPKELPLPRWTLNGPVPE